MDEAEELRKGSESFRCKSFGCNLELSDTIYGNSVIENKGGNFLSAVKVR